MRHVRRVAVGFAAGVALVIAPIVFAAASAGPASAATTGKIVYVQAGTLHVANPDGTGATAVTTTGLTVLNHPSLSPDGTRIVFEARQTTNDLFTVHVDGSGLTRLTNDAALDLEPQWSPDGTKITWTRVDSTSATDNLEIMNADGTSKAALDGFDDFATWSPDGSQLYVGSSRDGFSCTSYDGSGNATEIIFSQIYVMRPDGTGATRVSFNGADDAHWSYDDAVLRNGRLVFSATHYDVDRDGACDNYAPSVFTSAATGGTPSLVTTEAAGSNITLSPDGGTVMYSPVSAPSDLYTIPVTGGSPTLAVANAFAPDWQLVQTCNAPVANAGPDQKVTPKATVQLDGSASSDGSCSLSYSWTELSGPAVVLDNRNAIKPRFTAPSTAATITFRLTVTNGAGGTSSDTVVVTVAPK